MDDIRNSLNTEDVVQRIHLISRQDLRNIEKEFLLKNKQQLHKTDATSVDLWVQKCQNLEIALPCYFINLRVLLVN